MYKIFPLSLILRQDAIFTLAGHVQLKIMPIPLFKTKSYQILVSKPFKTEKKQQKNKLYLQTVNQLKRNVFNLDNVWDNSRKIYCHSQVIHK